MQKDLILDWVDGQGSQHMLKFKPAVHGVLMSIKS